MNIAEKLRLPLKESATSMNGTVLAAMHACPEAPGTDVVDPAAMAFGSTMLASAMLNNIFVSYYLDFFVNVIKVSPSGFYIGQLIFMASARVLPF
jgi:hypothetical protein